VTDIENDFVGNAGAFAARHDEETGLAVIRLIESQAEW